MTALLIGFVIALIINVLAIALAGANKQGEK